MSLSLSLSIYIYIYYGPHPPRTAWGPMGPHSHESITLPCRKTLNHAIFFFSKFDRTRPRGPNGSPCVPRGSPSRVARMINTWLARHNAFHAQIAKPQRNFNVTHTKTLLLLREIWEGIFKIRQYVGSHGSHAVPMGPHGSPCMGPHVSPSLPPC